MGQLQDLVLNNTSAAMSQEFHLGGSPVDNHTTEISDQNNNTLLSFHGPLTEHSVHNDSL